IQTTNSSDTDRVMSSIAAIAPCACSAVTVSRPPRPLSTTKGTKNPAPSFHFVRFRSQRSHSSLDVTGRRRDTSQPSSRCLMNAPGGRNPTVSCTRSLPVTAEHVDHVVAHEDGQTPPEQVFANLQDRSVLFELREGHVGRQRWNELVDLEQERRCAVVAQVVGADPS